MATTKRRRSSEAQGSHQLSKRLKPLDIDRISQLSDELILRILSYVPISDLVVCERLSHKYRAIAKDSQLWKRLYYDRFVLPRAYRIPGLKDNAISNSHFLFSSKLSKWLDEDNLVKRGQETDWKRQYRLRHNWSKGTCDVSEIQVAEQPSVPPLLVRLHEGVVFTADSMSGLRAWSSKKERKLLASSGLGGDAPTSLAVDFQAGRGSHHRVVVGFENGRFSIYELDVDNRSFQEVYAHAASSNGMLTAVAFASPYLLTMTASQLLSLYKFAASSEVGRLNAIDDAPHLLYSLRSHTAWPPLSLAIRPSHQSITATIAYAVPTILSGWSAGIQELRLSLEGELIDSRLATSENDSFRSLSSSLASPANTLNGFLSATPSPSGVFSAISRPTSLSYTHPYFLVSHPDNTLTLYMVTSTSSTLAISAGRRLWGHTSSVSGAHVGGRGKAVSVSTRGDELRIWELEGGISPSATRTRLTHGDLSVQVRSEERSSDHAPKSNASLESASQGDVTASPAFQDRSDDFSIARGWIEFDEENVVVLREKSQGGQVLAVYDFT